MNAKTKRLPLVAALSVGLLGGFGVSNLTGTDGAATALVTPSAPSGPVGIPAAADVFGRIPAIVRRVQPAVVSVLVETGRGGAEGSGVIFDGDEGLVVTNNHVVQGARSVEVVLASGERLDARVRATDSLIDLAVLSLPRKGLPEAELADELPPVGELAVALGNLLGFENSVTAGIVSGLHRSIPSGGRTPELVDLIQTDAPISPGNSGGALVDRAGRVIGINVGAIPPTPQSRAVSIGFAIPAPTVASVVSQLLSAGKARHTFLGVRPANLTPDLARRFGAEADEGVLVVSVVSRSAAARAGVRAGDVIVAFSDKPIRIVEDLFSTLPRYKPGDRITLTLVRDGARVDVSVTLAAQPGS